MRINRIGIISLAIGIASSAVADSVKLYRDDVIPVVMQSELTFKESRQGDRFKATVSDSHMLPFGSRLEGVVNRVEQKHGNKPAFMDIEFTTIILPDGHRTSFHGTPIALSKNYVTQDKYGRWEAKKGVKKETVVLGATAGGLVLGALIKKPFEGAILGALVGILGAETDTEHIGDGDVVIPKGSKVGARVDSNLSVEFDGRWDTADSRNSDYDREGYNSAGYDRHGYDRKGRYDAKYDEVKNGSQSDRDVSGYDKYGYDKDGHYDPKYDTTRAGRDRNGGNGSDSGFDKYGYDKDGRYDPKYDTTRDGSAPAGASDIRIEIDRKSMRYDEGNAPFRKGWIIMVPLRATAEQLGYTVNREETAGHYRVENESDVLLVEQDSRDYDLNNRRSTLPAAMEIRDGVAYVPIDAFTKLTKGSVYVNGTKYKPQA